ncbi:glycosyltransferase, partial [Vibrio anguillarum]|nr:glycosyltransferase [Vibrio anguillarum]
MGTAPIIIGMFFLGSVQIFFIGLVGEYVGHLVAKLSKFPLVIEKERINFD